MTVGFGQVRVALTAKLPCARMVHAMPNRMGNGETFSDQYERKTHRAAAAGFGVLRLQFLLGLIRATSFHFRPNLEDAVVTVAACVAAGCSDTRRGWYNRALISRYDSALF